MPNLIEGVGLGLRMPFAEELLRQRPSEIRWLEIHPENYMRRGGRYPAVLREALDHYPIATHGLTMSFGSLTPHEPGFLRDLRVFLREVQTPWHSDHLCFGAVEGASLHDLLPLPITEEAAALCAERLLECREALDLPLAVENVSYYAPCGDPTQEADFCVEVLERADALMLLDVNNVIVNSRNHGFDPFEFVDRIPPERVVQIHVAGHFVRDDHLRIDTHGEPVPTEVHELLAHTLRRMGPKPVLLERDNNIPPLDELLEEVRRLDRIYHSATAEWRRARTTPLPTTTEETHP